MEDNNIMLVKSGQPRTELQQAYDQIAVLEAKNENLELENAELKAKLWCLRYDMTEIKSILFDKEKDEEEGEYPDD